METAVIIPSYNEKDNIEKIISAIRSVLKDAVIIVVDDNSPDYTASVVKKLQKKDTNVHLIIRKQKDGRGSAVMAGFLHAFKNTKFKTFIEMDADFSHDPSELPLLIKKVKFDTVVIASRYLKGSRIIDWPLSRKITSRLSNFLIRSVLGLPIGDNTNGFRCYSRQAAEILIQHHFRTKGYIVLSESSYLLFKKGFQFQELKTVFHNRKSGKSKTTVGEFINSFINMFNILRLKT